MQEAVNRFKKTKYTCFFTYLATSSIFCLPPILFVTFREMYGISYTLLGTLVLINFCTQLAVDLVFSFFTRFFNVHKTIRLMPVLTSLGWLLYALIPMLFPQYAYVGLVLGTIVFSVSGGLCEVLLSPLVAALPSDNPARDMSALHSLYAYGVVMVVGISTVFLSLLGRQNWMYLALFWALLPLIAAFLFATAPVPEMDLSHAPAADGERAKRKGIGMLLCVLCIFLGSAAENAMTNWISGYIENALRIPKALGDILGLTTFAVLLGLVRTAYAKYGKNISAVLLWSMAGATVCYLTAALSPWPVLSMAACVLTGPFTSMLWPGTLILMEEKIPNPGITAYALMAAGGDFGGSVAPQMLGIVVDTVAASGWAAELGGALALTAEQIGMKAGMLMGTLFPLLGVGLLIYIRKYFKKTA